MTKTLTEQWRNGTLEESMYYVKLPEEIIIANIYQLKQLDLVNDADEIEVLAAVPSYEKFVELTEKVESMEKQLKEAEKALKDFCEDCTLSKCGGCDEDCAGWKAKEYLERYGVE